MGRGGHHFSGGHYHHHHSGSGESLPLSVTIPILLIFLFVAFLMDVAENDKIRNGEKLMEGYTITEYLYDNADYFHDSYEHLVVEGLQHFYETTGAQMVIVTQEERTTDELTEEKYYEMFNDESHVLLVLPITGFLGGNSVQYYYMGDEALRVIDETGINRLLENIENSWSSREKGWKEEIIDIADLIAS